MPTRRIRPDILLAFALTLGLAHTGLAQAPRPHPKLLHVFPPGGRAESTVEVTLGGDALDAADGLWFSHPGMRADRIAGKPKTFKVAIAPTTPLGAHDIRALTPDGLSNPRTFVIGALPESSESEPNGGPDAANPIAINSVVNGATTATDVDCFALRARKGQRLFVSVAAERVDSPLDATVRVLDARGAELAESRDAFGADPFVDVTLPADGRYVIKVHDVTYAGSADHIYRLTVRDGPTLDAAAPPIAAPGRLADLTLLGRSLRARRTGPPTGADPVDAEPWLGLPDFRPSPNLPVNAFGTAAAMRAFPLRVGRSENPSNPVLVAEASEPIVAEREPNGLDAPRDRRAPLLGRRELRPPGRRGRLPVRREEGRSLADRGDLRGHRVAGRPDAHRSARSASRASPRTSSRPTTQPTRASLRGSTSPPSTPLFVGPRRPTASIRSSSPTSPPRAAATLVSPIA